MKTFAQLQRNFLATLSALAFVPPPLAADENSPLPAAPRIGLGSLRLARRRAFANSEGGRKVLGRWTEGAFALPGSAPGEEIERHEQLRATAPGIPGDHHEDSASCAAAGRPRGPGGSDSRRTEGGRKVVLPGNPTSRTRQTPGRTPPCDLRRCPEGGAKVPSCNGLAISLGVIG